MNAGTLHVVATPIGNLEDLSARAVRSLREASVIACEDTRHTRKLLAHYGIERPVVSCHEHNEEARARELVERMTAGQHVALVTDAGTPLVSDPGYRLVRSAIDAGIDVVPIPGPSAAIAALAGSGLPTDAFYFGGFLPPKRTRRIAELRALEPLAATLVFFEAPHRLLDSLADLEETLGNRRIAVARELTKVHEEFVRGATSDVRAEFARRPAVKGEITLVIARREATELATEPVEDAVGRLIEAGATRMDAIKHVARERNLSKSDVYEAVERQKSAGKNSGAWEDESKSG